MLISQLGEFGLIKRFRRSIKTDASVIKGSGDDCAVIKFDRDNYLLFTCDMITQGVDFLPGDDPYLIGKKAVNISVSDIAACGGRPRYCLIALGLPAKTSLTYIDKLAKGFLAAGVKYKINIAGGDLSRADKLTVDVSMLGVVKKKNLILRSGAQKGDIIFVTGSLGGSIRGKHLSFDPRLKEALFLAENFKPTAMIDISDGLTQDLGHILEESRAGAVIYEDLIPLSADARNLSEALYMGEDFELLFTLRPQDAKRLVLKRLPGYKPIGEILDRGYGLKIVDRSGKEKAAKPRGFRHF
jgi:thiamine-monophosphate kinase